MVATCPSTLTLSSAKGCVDFTQYCTVPAVRYVICVLCTHDGAPLFKVMPGVFHAVPVGHLVWYLLGINGTQQVAPESSARASMPGYVCIRLHTGWHVGRDLNLLMTGMRIWNTQVDYMSEDDARWIFQQLIVAVDYCHRLGIANRDIKVASCLPSSFSYASTIEEACLTNSITNAAKLKDRWS